MPHRHSHTPPVIPTLFPVEEANDWTEAACLGLTAIGLLYFTGHLVVAATRGLVW